MTRRRIPSTVSMAATVAAVAVAVAGCASPTTGESGPRPRPVYGVVLDVSGSTVRARDDYVAEFADLAQAAAHERARLFVLPAAGDPLAESRVMRHEFTTKYEGQETYANADLARQARAVTEDVRALLTDPPLRVDGTALLRATVASSRELARYHGPRQLTLLTDAVENSRDLKLGKADLSERGIGRALDRLERRGLIAKSLDRVPVRFALPGYHPGGTRVEPLAVQRFWKGWAERTGAMLRYG